jgi:hypothetical protein
VPERYQINPLRLEDVPEKHPAAALAHKWPTFPKIGNAALWEHFTPNTCASILPWVTVVEKQERDGDHVYYFKHQGSEIEQLVGANSQGLSLEDVLAKEALKDRIKEFNGLVKNGGFLLSKGVMPIEGREFINIYRGVFAFTTTGDMVDKFVVVAGPETTVI